MEKTVVKFASGVKLQTIGLPEPTAHLLVFTDLHGKGVFITVNYK